MRFINIHFLYRVSQKTDVYRSILEVVNVSLLGHQINIFYFQLHILTGKRTLSTLSKLESLNLSHNAISHIVDANFDGLQSLTSLALSHNRIQSVISAAFHHLSSLESLYLNNNNIKELSPRIFYKLTKLKTLDMSHNKLLLIDEDVLKDVRNLQYLRKGSIKDIFKNTTGLLKSLHEIF